MKRYSIKQAEKEAGWFIEKENGMYVAKDDNFRPCFREAKLSELVRSLKIWNAEQDLITSL